jgi:SpoIID/LytB domain protein
MTRRYSAGLFVIGIAMLVAVGSVASAQSLPPVPVGAPVGTDLLPPPTAAPTPSSAPPTSAPVSGDPSATTTVVASAPPVRYLQITGKGFGHGRGLGQWGSYGYAVDLKWTAAQILDHYYRGTQAGRPALALQRVRLQAFDNRAVTIIQPKGLLFAGVSGQTPTALSQPVQAGGSTAQPTTGQPTTAAGAPVPVAAGSTGLPAVLPAPGSAPADTTPTTAAVTQPGAPTSATAQAPNVAVRVQQIAPGRYQLSDGPACDGPFTARQVIEGPGVQFTTDPAGSSLDPVRNPDPADMIQVCVGSNRRPYRGDLLLTTDGSTSRLINIVAMEQYLRSVVPSESPPGWADRPNGIEALKAQAVAARSYAAAERRSGPANTCDTTACQVYRGRGEFRGSGFTSFEDARTDRAIAETAGEVRLWSNGTVARTEFSSSTGGWTAPGDFGVVNDDGDATTANPYRQWTVRLSAERLEAGRNLGAFVSAEVTRRDGTGPDGGRARRVKLSFANGAVEIPSTELSGRFGFRSSYYSMTVMERAAGSTLEVGDVFQPADPTVTATGSGPSAGGGPAAGSVSGSVPGAPPDTGPVLAGTPDVANSVAASAAQPAASATTAAPSTTRQRRKSATTSTTVVATQGEKSTSSKSSKSSKSTKSTTTTSVKTKRSTTSVPADTAPNGAVSARSTQTKVS